MTQPADFPPVPSQVFSHLGPLPVEHKPLEESRGETELHPRTVTLDLGLSPAAAWQTYWHEATHVALWDAGITNHLPPKLEEHICDAIGTYLAAAVRSGFLRVNEP